MADSLNLQRLFIEKAQSKVTKKNTKCDSLDLKIQFMHVFLYCLVFVLYLLYLTKTNFHTIQTFHTFYTIHTITIQYLPCFFYLFIVIINYWATSYFILIS